MGVQKIPFERFNAGRPPAVVLGDLSLIRPISMAAIPVVLLTPEPRDVALRSRFLSGYRVVADFGVKSLDASAQQIIEVGARFRRVLGRKVPLFYSSDKNLELIYR